MDGDDLGTRLNFLERRALSRHAQGAHKAESCPTMSYPTKIYLRPVTSMRSNPHISCFAI